jgi:hypothetical protein
MPCQTYRQSSYPITILSALTLGIVSGLLIVAPLKGRSNKNVDRNAALMSANLADLPEADLEQLAADVLSTLTEKSKVIAQDATGKSESIPQPFNPRQILLGIKNARRLLPLAKRLTLESLRERVKTSALTKEARLIASVNRLVLDPDLGDSGEVRAEDLSKIWIGPDYATYLVSDDEAVLLLSHELTHVAARTGRLNNFIDSVARTARISVGIEFNQEQKEELACDFTAAEVLKRFIASHPTSEPSFKRFSLPFGYETPAKRLTRAWADFCTSYRGASRDDEHLSRDQTIRSLIVLDQDLKALVPDDALETRFCH